MKKKLKHTIRNGVGFVLAFGLFYWMTGNWKSSIGFIVGFVLFTFWCDWYDKRIKFKTIARRVEELKEGQPLVEDYLVIELAGDDSVTVSNDVSYLEPSNKLSVNYDGVLVEMARDFSKMQEKYPILGECVGGRWVNYRIVDINDDDTEEVLASRLMKA